ncbi:MAG: phosphotransferase [Lachnospiraceae bacterium]|nr:phosphotransferase [Lachnospiraceae bacterium]
MFDIFAITGFADLFDIHRVLRDFSIRQKEFLTDSVNGKIYALEDDNMLKVFRSDVTMEEADQEREYAHAALVCGIPTAIPFDVVSVGGGYGIVYEAVDMVTVANLVTADPASLELRAEQFAKLLRELHDTDAKDSGLPDIKDRYRQWVDVASPRLDPKTKQRILSLVESIPDRNTYVHGEINLSNVLLHRGGAFGHGYGGFGVWTPDF